MSSSTTLTSETIFTGPGEMRERCRALDWSATPLGPVSSWPPTLRIVASVVLASGLPALLMWGDSLVQLYNDACIPLMHDRHPRALGHPARETWPEIAPMMETVFERVRGGETVTYANTPHLLAAGPTDDARYITVSYAPVHDEVGQFAGVLVNVVDTTSAVQAYAAERARDEIEDRYALAAAAARLGTWTYEVATGAVTFDARLREMFGMTGPDEPIMFDDILAHVHPDDRDYVTRSFEQALDPAGMGRYETEYRVARSEGTERWLRASGRTLFDGTGPGRTPLRMVGTTVDVTEEVAVRIEVERLLAESYAARSELRASERRLRDVFDQSAAAIAVMTGPDHVYTVLSPSYYELVGHRDLLGRPVREALAELANTDVPKILDRVYQTGEPFTATERTLYLDRDGSGVVKPYVFNLNYRAIRDADGHVYAIASTAVDVSAQVEARRMIEAVNEELRRTNDELQRTTRQLIEQTAAADQANRAKGDFLATMSHELRTPLNAIGGYVDLIEMELRGPITEQQRADLARIRRSQQYLLSLINDVLNFVRLDTGQVRYDVADVPLEPLLVRVEELVLPQLTAKGLEYSRARVDDGIAMRADPEKVQQILVNLLTNATKFTPPGGRVSVDTHVDERVEIRISDTGVGIPRDKLEEIFDPFVQIGRDLSRPTEGVGLGLAISRDLARHMGGDVVASTGTGDEAMRGSTFTLTLPRASRGD